VGLTVFNLIVVIRMHFWFVIIDDADSFSADILSSVSTTGEIGEREEEEN